MITEVKMSAENLQMRQGGFFSAHCLHLMCCFRISAECQALYNNEYSLSLPEAENAASTASAEEAGKGEIRLMTSFLCSLLPAYCLISILNKFI